MVALVNVCGGSKNCTIGKAYKPGSQICLPVSIEGCYCHEPISLWVNVCAVLCSSDLLRAVFLLLLGLYEVQLDQC